MKLKHHLTKLKNKIKRKPKDTVESLTLQIPEEEKPKDPIEEETNDLPTSEEVEEMFRE